MTTTRAELFHDGHALLGEGPVWDAKDGLLLWLDIDAGQIWRVKPGGKPEHMDVGQKVGAVALRSEGGFALALKAGFALLDRWGDAVELVASPEKDKPKNRMNDGKCDSAGRFWAGTMSPERGDARLYRFDPDRSVHTMVEGVSCSNGLAWSLDDRTMYYIDTPTRRVDAFDFDAATGAISRRRALIEVPREHGSPDGMTIDESGCLWVAFWGGGAVRRYTPQGMLDRTVAVDARDVTCCVFGGSDRSELYITTASCSLGPAEREAHPHAGGVFVTRPGIKGTPVSAFAG